MKLLIALTIAVLGFAGNVAACDGCSMYEYTSLTNRTYVSLFYRYRAFNGYSDLGHSHRLIGITNKKIAHGGEEGGDERYVVHKNQEDYKIYRSYELRFNYTFKEKFNFTLLLPFQQASVYYKEVEDTLISLTNDTLVSVNGLGDVIVAVDWFKSSEGENFKHIVRPGLAFQLPTGSHKVDEHDHASFTGDLHRGMGAFGLIPRLNYLGVYKGKIGVSSFINGSFFTANSEGYRFGSRLNTGLSLLYIQRLFTELKLVPNTGVYYEYATEDEKNGEHAELTGGSALFYTAGLDVNFRKFTFQSILRLPVSDHLNGEQIGNAGRVIVGLVYNFN